MMMMMAEHAQKRNEMDTALSLAASGHDHHHHRIDGEEIFWKFSNWEHNWSLTACEIVPYELVLEVVVQLWLLLLLFN